MIVNVFFQLIEVDVKTLADSLVGSFERLIFTNLLEQKKESQAS